MPSIEQARAWYTDADPVHGFDHILRVYSHAEKIASMEGADIDIVRAAVLLHDAAGNQEDIAARKNHQILSSEFAGKILEEENWNPEKIEAVKHCIRSHRFRGEESPKSLEAKVVFDADKLDVLGAYGVARTIAYAVDKGQPIFATPSQTFLNTGRKRPGEPHSAYHEYIYKLGHIKDRLHTATALAMAEDAQKFLNEFFDRLSVESVLSK